MATQAAYLIWAGCWRHGAWPAAPGRPHPAGRAAPAAPRRAGRAGRPVTVDAATTGTSILTDPLTGYLVSPIVAAALCVKPRGLLTEAQAAKGDAFIDISPAFAEMRALGMRFQGTLRGGDVEKLSVWLHDADRSTLYDIRRFVHTRRHDLAAVGNAITETWSNGQTEGQINRLKTLKRAMYGRAGIYLLRARMIPLRPIQNHTN